MDYQDNRTPMQRIKSFMDQAGINPHLFSKNIGVPYSTMRDNLSGASDPKLSTLLAISNKLGLSLNWIILGTGPMYMKDVAQPVAYSPQPEPEQTVNDTYNINIGHSTQNVDQAIEQPTGPRITDTQIFIKQLIEQNHQLWQQNVLLMDQNRSIYDQLLKTINK